MTTSLVKTEGRRFKCSPWWLGGVGSVRPTFMFHIEGVVQTTPRTNAAVSECPGVKGQLQDSLARQHNLRVVHQLQTFGPKRLESAVDQKQQEKSVKCT